MSRETVETIVREFRGLRLHEPDLGSPDLILVALKGNTTIEMKFGTDGLEHYGISWIDTIKHVVVLPEVDLCHGALHRDAAED